MQNRNQSLDTWKGIAILAVIGIHACSTAISLPAEATDFWVGVTFRAILNFAVALFFAISGYFAPDAGTIRERGLAKYYISRLVPLWGPYLFWTWVYMAIRGKPLLFDINEIIAALFLGKGIGIGYFVVVLSSLIVIHPFFGRIPRGKAFAISAIISILTVLLLYWPKIQYPQHSLIKFPSITSIIFIPWMVFYYLGHYVRGKQLSGQPPIRKALLLSAIMFTLLLSLGESAFLMTAFDVSSFAVTQVKLTNYLYAMCVSLLALSYGFKGLDRIGILAWAGQRSFVLYLCHLLFLNVIRKVLDVPLFLENQVISIPVAIILTLLSASACIAIAERLLPEWAVRLVLGIRKKVTIAT